MIEFAIRNVELSDLDQIAEVHRASFEDRALSQLGKSAVKRYYRWLLTGFSDIYPVCAVSTHGKIAGFCFAGVYGGSFSGFLKNNRWFLIGTLMLRPWLFFKPIVREQATLAIRTLMRLIGKKNIHKTTQKAETPKPSKPTSLGILSIAVHPDFQRQGVGELMMAAVEMKAAADGFTQLHLSVHPENTSAVRFYEKSGWQKTQSRGTWDGKMFKKLNEQE